MVEKVENPKKVETPKAKAKAVENPKTAKKKEKVEKTAKAPKVGGWRIREVRNKEWISVLEAGDGRNIKAVLIRQSFLNRKPANAGFLFKKAVESLAVVEEALRASFGEIPPEFGGILKELNQLDIRRTKGGYSVKYRHNQSSRQCRYFVGYFSENWTLIGLSEPRVSVRGVRA